jgi:isoleucyl-tRNA synthetase
MEYKDTLNLPRTDFPMRANLPQREPETLARWAEAGLYERLLKHREHAPTFLLHDGPPYANGNIHIGHALNKVLKDIILKYRHLAGCRTQYSYRHGIEQDIKRFCGPNPSDVRL